MATQYKKVPGIHTLTDEQLAESLAYFTSRAEWGGKTPYGRSSVLVRNQVRREIDHRAEEAAKPQIGCGFLDAFSAYYTKAIPI